jgi:hypothetical protein
MCKAQPIERRPVPLGIHTSQLITSPSPDHGRRRLGSTPAYRRWLAVDLWTRPIGDMASRRTLEQGEIDIDSDDDKLAAQLGSIK